MKIKKTLLAAIVAAGVSVAGVSAHAEPGNGFNGNGFGPGIPGAGLNALDGIDLTKKQRKQIQTILQEAHRQDQAQDLRGDFDKIHRQIEDALTSPVRWTKTRLQRCSRKWLRCAPSVNLSIWKLLLASMMC